MVLADGSFLLVEVLDSGLFSDSSFTYVVVEFLLLSAGLTRKELLQQLVGYRTLAEDFISFI